MFSPAVLPLTIACLVYAQWTFADSGKLPKLPVGAVTPEWVLRTARDSSDSYKSILAGIPLDQAIQLRTESLYSPRFSASATRLDNRYEPTTGFEPSRIQSTTLRVGASKSFLTGTTVTGRIEGGANEVEFGPTLTPLNYRLSETNIEVSQSLWKNSLGKSDRALGRMTELSQSLSQASRRADQENWTLGILNEFYSAWLAQHQVRTSVAAQERRQRLLKITQVKLSRGNAEMPDLLQVEASHLSAQAQVLAAREALQTQWRSLWTLLKLSEEYLNLDAEKVPLALDTVTPKEAKAACIARTKKDSKQDSTSNGSALRQVARTQSLLAAVAEEKALSDHAPDLKLVGAIGANGVDPSLGSSFEETRSARHPYWRLGLSLEFPIGLSETKAALIQARSELVRSQAAERIAADSDHTGWLNACSELERQEKTRDWLKIVSDKQLARVKLDSERFRIAKVPLTQVLSGEDDEASAVTALQSQEVQLRLAAWRVIQLSGSLPEKMESFR